MWKTLIYNKEELHDFLINTKGTIKSVKTNVEYTNYVGRTGYVLCSLPQGKRGSCKNLRIHKALAETFLENPNNYPVVHHIDGNKTNNELCNLEWVTYKTNTRKHWLKASEQHAVFNNRKLTKEQVCDILKSKTILGCRELSEKYKVSKVTIYNVWNGKYYSNGV
jgi:hypothetical protein